MKKRKKISYVKYIFNKKHYRVSVGDWVKIIRRDVNGVIISTEKFIWDIRINRVKKRIKLIIIEDYNLYLYYDSLDRVFYSDRNGCIIDVHSDNF